MYSKEQKEQDALCRLLLEEALVRIAAEEGIQVDRVEWRDLVPDGENATLREQGPGKVMKVWSGNRWHCLHLTMEEFQGCQSQAGKEHEIEGRMVAFLREYYLRAGNT